jgi:RNA polymerase sigma factor (sigma-70 family)
MIIREPSRAGTQRSLYHLSRFLRLPVPIIRTRIKSLRGAFHPATVLRVDPRSVAQTLIPPKPRLRLPLTLEKAEKNRVNTWFERLRNATSEEEKSQAQAGLYKELFRYAKAVLYVKFQEYDEEVAHKIARELTLGTDRFRGDSTFSTYAYGAIKKQAVENRRRMGRYKKHVDTNADFETVIAKAAQQREKRVDISHDPLTRLLCKDIEAALKPREARILDCLLIGLDAGEIAASLNIKKKTAETQIRRLTSPEPSQTEFCHEMPSHKRRIAPKASAPPTVGSMPPQKVWLQ